MTDKRKFVNFSLIGVPEHVFRHFSVSHAVVVVRVAVVSQVEKVHIARVAPQIILESERSPVLALAEEAVEEEDVARAFLVVHGADFRAL